MIFGSTKKLYSTASIYGTATRVQHHKTRWTDVVNRWMMKTWGRQGLIPTTGTLMVNKSRKILICVSMHMFVPIPRTDWLGKWFVFKESAEYVNDRKVTVPTVGLGVTVFRGALRIQKFITLSTMFLIQFHPPLSIFPKIQPPWCLPSGQTLQNSPKKFHVHLSPTLELLQAWFNYHNGIRLPIRMTNYQVFNLYYVSISSRVLHFCLQTLGTWTADCSRYLVFPSRIFTV